MRQLKPMLITLLLFFGQGTSAQQTENERFSDLNLEQLMDMSVTVTSEKTQSLREAPGVVSVITSDEIKNSGARDLQDVLRLVPGLTLNGEVESTPVISFRGIYAAEGKILVRLDGQDWNELAYSNFVVGDRLPIEMIDRVEIIRGPGSVRYGGWAEVAVIDIHTKNFKKANGLHLATTGGILASGVEGRHGFTLGASKAVNETLGYSLLFYRGKSRLADRVHTSIAGVSTDMQNTNNLPFMLNASVSAGGFKLRLIRENYVVDGAIDGSGAPLDFNSAIAFSSTFAEAAYEGRITSDWNYRASYHFNQQQPWWNTDSNVLNRNMYYDKTFTRQTAKFLVKNDESKPGFYSFGVEYRTDHGRVNSAPEGPTVNLFFPNSANPTDTISQNAYAVYGETIQQTDFGNFSAGIRHESTSNLPSSTVPRFAFTKLWETWHLKALLSMAFRAPTFENYSWNPDVRPETTRTHEIEVGKRLSSDQQLTMALFDTQISDPIVYGSFISNGSPVDGYQNLDKTGARGLELEWKLKRANLLADAAWTYATSRGMNGVSKYESGDENRLLGIPEHKIILRSAWSFASDWWLSPTLVWRSAVRGWMPVSTGSDVVDFAPSTFASLALRRENLFVKNLSLLAGGSNLLNENQSFIPAYRSSSSDLSAYPGPSREIYGRLEYNVEF